MRKKIVFLDVDGTLTLPSGDVSQYVKDAISFVRKNGHYVFLCTGRNKSSVSELMSIGFDGIICSAGGYIEINNQKIYESFLKEDDVKVILTEFWTCLCASFQHLINIMFCII